MQRLDKILSDAGVASRKELRGLIRTGRVQVNGVPALRPEEKFDEKTAELMRSPITEYAVTGEYIRFL